VGNKNCRETSSKRESLEPNVGMLERRCHSLDRVGGAVDECLRDPFALAGTAAIRHALYVVRIANKARRMGPPR